jgi:hypothetical protein
MLGIAFSFLIGISFLWNSTSSHRLLERRHPLEVVAEPRFDLRLMLSKAADAPSFCTIGTPLHHP